MRSALALLAALLLGCPAAIRPWRVEGAPDPRWEPQANTLIDTVRRQQKSRLPEGVVVVHTPPNWLSCRYGETSMRFSGCSESKRIDLLWWPERGLGRDGTPCTTALAHEACHLALGEHNQHAVIWDPLRKVVDYGANEKLADQCAAAATLSACPAP